MDDFNKTPNIYPNLNAIPLNANISNEQQFRLNKINEIKDYFIAEIKERELMSKKLSKYIASFEYFDTSWIVLSVTTGSISNASSFATVIGAPVGIANARYSLAFLISTGIIKKLLKTTRNKKKKHNKIVMLARSKLNSIENKISEALINNEISHEDFSWQLLMKKRDIKSWKKALEWWIIKEVVLKNLVWLKKVKKKMVLMKFLSAMKLLITV